LTREVPISCSTFKFLALAEVESGQIVETTVGIKPFFGLSTLSSAKNLKVELETRQSEAFGATIPTVLPSICSFTA
jgi:hypothetical protein